MCYDTGIEDLIYLGRDDSHESAYENYQLNIKDTRTKVRDVTKYPYNCVGLIVARFSGDQCPVYGTGFLIDEFCVVTVSHNICHKQRKFNPVAEEIFYIPDAHGQDTQNGRIRVKDKRYCL